MFTLLLMCARMQPIVIILSSHEINKHNNASFQHNLLSLLIVYCFNFFYFLLALLLFTKNETILLF